ncbi:hypothetical protein Tco_1506141 [Tanacetum coccineum]
MNLKGRVVNVLIVFMRKKKFLERVNPGSKTKSKDDVVESICSCHFQKAEIPRSGGSILQLMDNLVKMGQTMGYNMEGCMNNMEEIIESQGGNESHYNYRLVPFRFFHYWFEMEGFDKFVEESWKEALVAEANALIKMMKKLKYLKEKIGVWNKTNKESPNNSKRNLKVELAKLDSAIDKGEGDGDCNPCHFVRSECSNLVL